MDQEVVLKMLVEMGVINAGQIDDLREKLGGLGDEGKKTSDDMSYLPEDFKNLGKATDGAGKSALLSSGHHRELRMALNELNRVIPGLGHVVYMLEEGLSRSSKAADAAKVSTEGLAAGMDGEAVAAGTAAAANESFIISLGPIAILLLGIQAAMTAWEYYKSSVKAAEEQQTELFKKLDEDSKKALETWQKIQDIMNPKPEATKKYTDELERQNAVLDEQEKKEAEVRKIKGTTPEAEARAAEQSTGDHFEITAQVASAIQAEIAKRKSDQSTLKGDYDSEVKYNQPTEATAKAATENAEAIVALTSQLEGLQDKLKTGGAVYQARNQGDVDVEKAKITTGGEDSTVVAGLTALNQSGGKLNTAQKRQFDSLESVFDTLIGNHDALHASLVYSHNHLLTQEQEIKLIQQQLRNLAQRG